MGYDLGYIKTVSGILKVIELCLCIAYVVTVVIFGGKESMMESLSGYAGIVFTLFILVMATFRTHTSFFLLPFEILLYWRLVTGVQHAIYQNCGLVQIFLELITAIVYLTDIIRTSVIHRTMLFIPLDAGKERRRAVARVPKRSSIVLT